MKCIQTLTETDIKEYLKSWEYNIGFYEDDIEGSVKDAFLYSDGLIEWFGTDNVVYDKVFAIEFAIEFNKNLNKNKSIDK